jgi:uncharacterized protein (DUF2252 family)
MMLVELGNPNPVHLGPISPAVTYLHVEGAYLPADVGVEMEVGSGQLRPVESAADLAVEVMRQIARGGGITHLPDQEAILSVIAAWNAESSGAPSWVWSSVVELAGIHETAYLEHCRRHAMTQ